MKRFWEFEDISNIKQSELLHDKNFNNKRKIKLEHTIAKLILANPPSSMLYAIEKVNTTTRSFVQYIKDHRNPSSDLMFKIFFEHVGAMTDQLGRDRSLGDDCRVVSREVAQQKFLPWLEKMLAIENPTPDQLCSIIRIHVAADYVLFDGLIKNDIHHEAINHIIQTHPELIYDEHHNYQMLHKNLRNEGSICDSKDSVIYRTRGRLFRKQEGDESTVLTRQFGLFPFCQEIKDSKLLPWHRRGMDWYRAGSKYLINPKIHNNQYGHSRYVCAAILKDMPLVCSSSTTAARLLRYAAACSTLTIEEYWLYALVHMSYNILSGHHTFHEMATIMRLVEIPYQDGNYASLFSLPELQSIYEQLHIRFPALFSVISDNRNELILKKSLFHSFLEIDEKKYEPPCPHFPFS
jgi:hypothetical protein